MQTIANVQTIIRNNRTFIPPKINEEFTNLNIEQIDPIT